MIFNVIVGDVHPILLCGTVHKIGSTLLMFHHTVKGRARANPISNGIVSREKMFNLIKIRHGMPQRLRPILRKI